MATAVAQEVCDRAQVTQDLMDYTKNLHEYLKSQPAQLVFFSEAFALEYKILNSYTVNKSSMTEESLDSLYEAEESLVTKADEVYENHIELLDQFGEEPSDENLYGHINHCWPNLKVESLLQVHSKNMAQDTSIASSFYNTLYKYSDILLSFADDVLIWLEDNNSGSVPSSNQFESLLQLSQSAHRVPACGVDLVNVAFSEWCDVLNELGLKTPLCQAPVLPVFGHPCN